MTRAGAGRGEKPSGGPHVAAPGDICAARSTGKMQSGREDAAGDDDGAARGGTRGHLRRAEHRQDAVRARGRSRR
jgi:hypothetical protein